METTCDVEPTILLNLNEVAAHLRLTRRTTSGRSSTVGLRTVHLGGSVRVERAELERFIASMRDLDEG